MGELSAFSIHGCVLVAALAPSRKAYRLVPFLLATWLRLNGFRPLRLAHQGFVGLSATIRLPSANRCTSDGPS